MNAVVKTIKSEEAGLVESIKLNRQEQQVIHAEVSELHSSESKYESHVKDAITAAVDALDVYTHNPTPQNKEALTLSRTMELEAQADLGRFNEGRKHHASDLEKLRAHEKQLMKKLVHMRRNAGENSLRSELEKLRKRLTKDLPRFLGLFSELEGLPPATIGIERCLCRQLDDLKPNHTREYLSIVDSLTEIK